MCGIIGYIESSNRRDKSRSDFITHALYVDVFRGRDSTGLFSVDTQNQVHAIKAPVAAPQFMAQKTYSKAMQIIDSGAWAAVGHNRAATKGKVNRDNAHPFQVGPVTLVHNGTLTNMGRNLPGYDKKNHPDVDSWQLAASLAYVEPSDSNAVLRNVMGSYAAVWFDSRDNTLNIARNRERPFHLGYTYDKEGMYFMSEGEMLWMLSQRRGWACPQLDKIYRLRDQQHLKFKQGSLTPELLPIASSPTSYGGYSGKVPAAAPKAAPPTSSNGTMGTGKDQPAYKLPYAPAAHAKALEEVYQLDDGVEAEFEPKSYVPWNKGIGCVVGTITHPEYDYEMSAHVYGMSWQGWQQYRKINWTVYPVGFNCRNFDKDEAAIICRFEAFRPPPPACDYEEEPVHTPKALMGPNNRVVSLGEWVRLTKFGCASCSADLLPEEHEDIEWYMDYPFCLDCATEPDEEEE